MGLRGAFWASCGRLGLYWECLWFGGRLGCVFESFLATSWGCLGASWGVFLDVLDVLRAARVVLGSFLSPRWLDRVAKRRGSQHVFLKAHGVAVTWFQSGRASEASGASGRSCDSAQLQKASANATSACS